MDQTLLNRAKRHLRKTDAVMAQLIKHCPQISPATTNQPHYHALVRSIINQQLSVKAGRTIEKRIQTIHGGRYFRAERLVKLRETVLRECGISHNKIRYIHTLAHAILDGELNFRKLVKQDDDTIRHALTQYPGIGPWSADMFLITALRRPDVFPLDDLVLRKSMQRHYRLTDNTKRDGYFTLAEAWRPYRTIACYYLWNTAA